MRQIISLLLISATIGCVSQTRVTAPTETARERLDKSLAEMNRVDIERRKRFVADHPELSAERRNAILSGRYEIGMTPDEVRAAIGDPWHVNRSRTRWASHEQWIYYGTTYLYFTNGKLDAWQN